jgi:hypothetical protein
MKVYSQNITILINITTTCVPERSEENNNMPNASVYVLKANKRIMLMEWIK